MHVEAVRGRDMRHLTPLKRSDHTRVDQRRKIAAPNCAGKTRPGVISTAFVLLSDSLR